MSRQEWVLANWQTPDHICTFVRWPQAQTSAAGPCLYFSAHWQTLWHHEVPTELPVTVFLKKSYFHEGGRGILNESCTQLLLWNTHDLKTDTGTVRFLLTGKCSASSCPAPLLALHFSENSKSYNHSFYGKCAQVTGRGHFSVSPGLLPSPPK